MVYLAWVVSIVYLIALALSIPFGVFALAVSPAKGQTFKRMLLVFISVAPAVLVIGFVAAGVFHSHPIARLTGLFSFPLGMLAGGDGGMDARPIDAEATTSFSHSFDPRMTRRVVSLARQDHRRP